MQTGSKFPVTYLLIEFTLYSLSRDISKLTSILALASASDRDIHGRAVGIGDSLSLFLDQ